MTMSLERWQRRHELQTNTIVNVDNLRITREETDEGVFSYTVKARNLGEDAPRSEYEADSVYVDGNQLCTGGATLYVKGSVHVRIFIRGDDSTFIAIETTKCAVSSDEDTASSLVPSVTGTSD